MAEAELRGDLIGAATNPVVEIGCAGVGFLVQQARERVIAREVALSAPWRVLAPADAERVRLDEDAARAMLDAFRLGLEAGT